MKPQDRKTARLKQAYADVDTQSFNLERDKRKERSRIKKQTARYERRKGKVFDDENS